MRRFIRVLSARAEFTIVIVLAFGWFFLGSTLSLLSPYRGPPITEAGLNFLLIYESGMLIVLGTFLAMRGWSLQQLGVQITLNDTGMGIVLLVVASLACAAVSTVGVLLMPGIEQSSEAVFASSLSLTAVVAISILNPIFEELFVCGYVISALKESRGAFFAINTSLGIRVAYHLYQGPIGALEIFTLGLVFALWYAKTGRLWPVIVAHAIFDFVGLWAFVVS